MSAALPAPVVAILDAIEIAGLTELERVLRARLSPPATAAKRRVDELGPLARILDAQGVPDWRGFSVVDRQDYDASRPADAPASHTLVLRFHTWAETCRAADGLLDDGRYHGAGRPWPQRRGVTPTRYAEEDCLDAISVCTREVGREPSSNEYAIWCRAKRDEARRTGAEKLPPTLKTIYRFWPAASGGWSAAIGAAETRV